MMKTTRNILLAIGLQFSIGCWAQIPLDSLKPAIQLPRLDKVLPELQQAIEAEKGKYEQCKNIDIKQIKGDIAKKKADNKKLKKEIAQMLKDSTRIGKEIRLEKSRIMQKHGEEMKQLKLRLEADNKLLAYEKNSLDSLSGFRKSQQERLKNKADNAWTKMPFSEIDTTRLQKDMAQYAMFTTDTIMQERLKTLLEQCKTYQQGVDAVSTIYDAQVVKSLSPKIKAMRDATNETTEPARYKDLARLYKQLDNYEVSAQNFQELIKKLDEEKSKGGSQNDVWTKMSNIIKKQELDDEVVSYIKVVPWLKEKYESYIDVLKKDYTAPNPAHDAIIGLKIND